MKSIVVPLIVNLFCDQSRQSWKIVFIMAAVVHFFGVTFYAVFASGELQPWAEPSAEEKKKVWNPLEEGDLPKSSVRVRLRSIKEAIKFVIMPQP